MCYKWGADAGLGPVGHEQAKCLQYCFIFKHIWVGVILQKQLSHFCELPQIGDTGHNLSIL